MNTSGKSGTSSRTSGETPASVIARCGWRLSCSAESAAESRGAEGHEESRRVRALLERRPAAFQLLAAFYALKLPAAAAVLVTSKARRTTLDTGTAERDLDESLEAFAQLTKLTEHSYRFANSMQTGHRKIPFPGAANGVGTNYHWSQVLPLYEKELADFRAQVEELKKPRPAGSATGAPIAAWPAAKFKLISTNAETYEVKIGARPFADRKYTITGTRAGVERPDRHPLLARGGEERALRAGGV